MSKSEIDNADDMTVTHQDDAANTKVTHDDRAVWETRETYGPPGMLQLFQ